jgi:hypothetical protein
MEGVRTPAISLYWQVGCRTLLAENKGFPLGTSLNLLWICGFRYGYFKRLDLAKTHLFISGQFDGGFPCEDKGAHRCHISGV